MTIKKSNKNNDDKKMNYKETRKAEVTNHIAEIRQDLKPHIWENIPLVGCVGYLVRMISHKKNIGNGVLRKQMSKYQLIFTFSTIFIYNLLTILTPWALYGVAKYALCKTEKLVDNDQI